MGQKKSIIATIKSYLYVRVLTKFRPNPSKRSFSQVGSEEQLPIAMICDIMTWENVCQNHAAISVTPSTWKRTFAYQSAQKIGFFFCEATWSGTVNACWRGQVYNDRRVYYENRRNLLKILERCKTEGIPTVFWAKEDPVFFQDDVYDFTDTALRFDYILTTAKECIPKYHALGHEKVYPWAFGFSKDLYHPPMNTKSLRENVAVFAGSWFKDYPYRCKDLVEIFEMVLAAGISLRIYDRNRTFGVSKKPFPEKYQSYVTDAIPYEKLGDIYRNVEYVINVNTVQDSETMFSRRVYEAMACGCIIVSNDSQGLREQFGENIWYLNQTFDFKQKGKICQQNIEAVFASHTWEQRMEQLYSIMRNDGSRRNTKQKIEVYQND